MHDDHPITSVGEWSKNVWRPLMWALINNQNVTKSNLVTAPEIYWEKVVRVSGSDLCSATAMNLKELFTALSPNTTKISSPPLK